MVDQGTSVAAAGIVLGQRRRPGGEAGVHGRRRGFHELFQLAIELDLRPPVAFAVIERAAGHLDPEHFLQAKRLRAELHLVGSMGFRFAPLVLHRQNPAVGVEFDDVTLAGNSQPQRAHRHPAGDPDARARLVRAVVSPGVHDFSLGGEFVFRPSLLDMDQRALPRAIQPVLERGDGNELVLVVHGGKTQDLKTQEGR